jgi:hypothetical protein
MGDRRAGVFEAASGCWSPTAAACSPISRLAIADADANIDTVSMERPDGGDVLAMFFGVQVRDRRHLAQVLKSLTSYRRRQARPTRTARKTSHAGSLDVRIGEPIGAPARRIDHDRHARRADAR